MSLLGISDAAEKLGFKTLGARLSFEKLANDVPLPCIVHWKQEHFVVVYDVFVETRRAASPMRAASLPNGYVRVADPAHGLINLLY